MPELVAKKEGVIPSKTWDTFIELGIKAKHGGDARAFLRDAMEMVRHILPNIVMLKHGQEPWTSNLFHEEHSPVLLPYKTKIEVRIYGQSLLRAKQELAKLMRLWEHHAKKYNIYRIYRLKDLWTERK